MSSYSSNGHSASVVAFTASKSEFWYYESFVKPTFVSTFGIEGRLFLRNDGTTRYHINSKDLLDYFAELGVPVGKKRDASIPPRVLQEGEVVPFLRGLYHAEGSIYRRYSKKYNRQVKIYDNLLVVQIRMKLKTLMYQVRDELMALGVSCNRMIDAEGVYTLRITDQAEIEKFLTLLHPKLKLQPHR